MGQSVGLDGVAMPLARTLLLLKRLPRRESEFLADLFQVPAGLHQLAGVVVDQQDLARHGGYRAFPVTETPGTDPFGQALAVGKGNPAVTVGKGTVSSLRQDENGELSVVQIDGAEARHELRRGWRWPRG